MHIPKFGDIRLELFAKSQAIFLATAPEVAADINDVMTRASDIILEARNALEEIKRMGIENGRMNEAAIRADCALQIIQVNTK